MEAQLVEQFVTYSGDQVKSLFVRQSVTASSIAKLSATGIVLSVLDDDHTYGHPA